MKSHLSLALLCLIWGREASAAHAEGCWEMALKDTEISFSSLNTSMGDGIDVKATCDGISIDDKRRITFMMTICHLYSHGRQSSLFDRENDYLCGDCIKQVETLWNQQPKSRVYPPGVADLCAPLFSDASFGIYTEFMNHFDNLCYYYISQSWFARVGESVDSLLSSSKTVITELQNASKLQRLVVDSQRTLNNMQKDMQTDVHMMGDAIAKGTNQLEALMNNISRDLSIHGQTLSTLLNAAISTINEIREMFEEVYLIVARRLSFVVYAAVLLVTWSYVKHLRSTIRFTMYGCILLSGVASRYSVDWSLHVGVAMLGLLVYTYGLWTHQTDVQVIKAQLEQMQRAMETYTEAINTYQTPNNTPPRGTEKTIKVYCNDSSTLSGISDETPGFS